MRWADEPGGAKEKPPLPRNPHPCPTCGGEPRASQTQYGVRYSCCRLWAWGPYPVVSAETHAARKKAHDAFDALWRKDVSKLTYGHRGPVARNAAYKRLSEILGLTREQCHMKLMDAETARLVPLAASRIKVEWIEKGLWKEEL